MTKPSSPSAAARLGGLGLALCCLLQGGCHRYLGGHSPDVFQPSESRDEAIRQKAASDPFAPAGQPVADAVSSANPVRASAR